MTPINNVMLGITDSLTLLSSTPSSYWIAVLAGAVAVAVFLLWTKQQQLQQQQSRKIDQKTGSRRRTQSESDDTSDTISVEGSVMVTLPTWAIASSPDYFSRRYDTDHDMMSLAIHLSDRNVSEGTGGPFGAAVFERHPRTDGGGSYCTLVSIGCNRVVPLGNSTLHGEMVAIQLAQRKVGSHTLNLEDEDGDGLFYEEVEGVDKGEGTTHDICTAAPPTAGQRKRQFELFSSCEPCAMCLGATLWSGASRIVCGATKVDAQAIGFDEGPVFEESYQHLERCGVAVCRNVLGEEAATVLRRYGGEGVIYNR